MSIDLNKHYEENKNCSNKWKKWKKIFFIWTLFTESDFIFFNECSLCL